MKVATLADLRSLAQCGDCRKIKYSAPPCNRVFRVPELVPVAAAHSIEWNIMGKERPWWSVLTHEDFVDKTQISKELKDKFFNKSRVAVKDIENSIQAYPEYLKPRVALDFGCGLGRISNVLADYYPLVFCADQSIFHLRLGKKSLDALYPETGNRVFTLLTNLNLVGNLYNTYNTLVDGVYTYIVLQHSISVLQALFIEQFCDILVPGGVGSFQIPASRKHVSCDFETSIEAGGLQMYATPIEEIEKHLGYRGCKIINTRPCDMTGGDFESTCIRFQKLVITS